LIPSGFQRHSPVKRAQDQAPARAGLALLYQFIVMRGLDPRIHQSSQESFEEDGLPGQARQ
jgi:hypothetical protein